jgi:arabinose-5-phosphate isomerase
MTRSTKSKATENATASSDLAAARRVLRLEEEALQNMSEALDGSFTEALEILFAVTGRVVVTGMGKSGHIARKISATLASTGTPSHYVHPAEASHGDMGMITRSDAVLALSNSGETPELGNLVDYCRRFRISLIALTGKPGSTLASNSDCALILPAVAEACPMGLAPTTSTTAMLAMGDALAVSLLERRGFTTEDFQVLHPGGKLGQGLLRVDDLMHSGDELPLTGPDAAMSNVLITMTNKRFGCVGVVDAGGHLAGIVTDGDLRRHMSKDLLDSTAGEVMTEAPKTIRLGALASEALGTMNDNAITALFVVEGGVPVGILHIHDCLRAGVT